ncbi:hypothetical protein LPTSP3_g30540 [Leptospira kobayashii]|uniref:Lipoprotein n=1 Tax=Leptospira kobayashii TaxID=1917830 RepID=A0ABM7UMG4_9LEPT|nr:hypothetical protein [Leptospira kobayashii]BDA80124.1 hypothetical protein LPTSP3_g30540 [Leptospira kobayashii]
MKNRLIYVIVSFVLLFFLFFFLEEKTENITETNYWKENWKSVVYFPPKETWCGEKEPAFGKDPIFFRMFERGWRKSPIFSVSYFHPDEKDILTYEGNFNVKNSFSDLSVLKTKFIESSSEEIQKSYCIGEDAPRLVVNEDLLDIKFDDLPGRTLYFGKKTESDTARVAAREKDHVISPYSYLIEKFRNNSLSFRERQFVIYSGGYLASIEFTGQGQRIVAENNAKKNQYDSYVNHWNRPTGERIVLSPEIGNALESSTKSLRADLYPDDENGPGLSFSKDAVKPEPEGNLFVKHSLGYKWKIRFYPKVQWKNQNYRPVVRDLSPYFEESPSFVKEETFQNFIQAVTNVKNASRWERPNQKIQ